MENGEKLLKLNICYKLPDDFNGDLNDAIEHLLNYRRSKKNHDKHFKSDPNKDVYSNWWDMIHETDRILFGEVSLAEFNGQEFKKLSI